MSDERLRELRRAFVASGSQETEVAYLQARLRGGDVSSELVQALAGLGHPAARQVQGSPRSEIPHDADQFTARLAQLGPLSAARGALALLDHCLRHWREALEREDATVFDVNAVALARNLQARAEAWMTGEQEAPLAERAACRALYDATAFRWRDVVPSPTTASLADIALTVSQLLPLQGEEIEEEWDREVEFDRRLPFYEFLRRVVTHAHGVGRPGEALQGAALEVSRWALGYEDALSDRARRRRVRSGRHPRGDETT